MKLRFTKMQGAGNDFVVLDATRHPMPLSADQLRRVADRRFGVGCDQVLVIEAPKTPDVDFGYRIFNSDGSEVEQCGNGARCFVRFVVDKGLTDKRTIRVQTINALLELRLRDDGRVTVDMGAPVFDHRGYPATVITAIGPAGSFDYSWSGPIAAAMRQRAEELSRKLGFAGLSSLRQHVAEKPAGAGAHAGARPRRGAAKE